MCGFLTFFQLNNNNTFRKANFQSAAKLLDHRGRDEYRELFLSKIKFAFHRLSIRDLSKTGSQPIYSNNGRYIMVFNGEIYNSRDLKKLLNFKLSGTSDSEVLINLYQKFGTNFLKLIKGMFSIFIYDKFKNQCFIARDRFGIKPLYYYKNDNFLVCSSEVKPLLHYLKNYNFNNNKFAELFFRQNLDGGKNTFFENIYSFLPATYYQVSKNSFTKNKYWEINNTQQEKSSLKTLKKFELLLKNSVKRHSISDRDISILLSGGFDSTIILDVYSKLNTKPIETFTYDFTFNKFSELFKAKKISKELGFKNHSVKVDHNYVINNFDKIITELESPFTSIRLFGLRSVFELMSKMGKKVVFEGGGGDEILGGYRYNFMNNILDNTLERKENNLMNKLSLVSRNNDDFKSIINTVLFQNNATKDCDIFYDESVIDNNFYNNYYKLKNYELNQNSDLNFLKNSQSIDINEVNLPRSLKYMDRLAMNQNIENRVPLLDEELAKFCFNLENKYKYSGQQSRYIFKKYFKKNKLSKFVTRSKKTITDPQSLWMKTYLRDFVMDEFNSIQAKNLGLFNTKNLVKNFDLFTKNKYKNNNSFLFFLIFTTIVFYKNFKKI